jgi:hypothetical protein
VKLDDTSIELRVAGLDEEIRRERGAWMNIPAISPTVLSCMTAASTAYAEDRTCIHCYQN